MQNVNTTAVNALIAKYSAIKGDYEDNVYDGCVHYVLDSGIFTDAFSEQDAERVAQAGIDCDIDICIVECNERVKAYDGGNDLDCIQLFNELEALGVELEDIAEA
jgi:hypothetical protein